MFSANICLTVNLLILVFFCPFLAKYNVNCKNYCPECPSKSSIMARPSTGKWLT